MLLEYVGGLLSGYSAESLNRTGKAMLSKVTQTKIQLHNTLPVEVLFASSMSRWKAVAPNQTATVDWAYSDYVFGAKDVTITWYLEDGPAGSILVPDGNKLTLS